MLDIISIIITVIVTVLVIMLTVIGIEIYKTLKQAQKSLLRLDEILEDFSTVSNSVATPVAKISSLVQGFQESSTVINLLAKVAEKIFKSQKNDEQ